MYEIGTSLGKLTVEVNAFKRYFFVVVTYSALLKVDGSLQIAQKTKYVFTAINRTINQQFSAYHQIAKPIRIG